MTVFSSVNDPEITRILTAGGIGILRTDTLYGIVGRADDEAAVARIYSIKHRNEAKSPIVLIADIDQLFDQVPETAQRVIDASWPGRVSIILPSQNAPTWIRRDNHSVAYRLPDNAHLRALLKTTGPLVAPSANPEGEPPAMNIAEAQAYFGATVDFYIDGGQVSENAPSQLMSITPDGQVERLR